MNLLAITEEYFTSKDIDYNTPNMDKIMLQDDWVRLNNYPIYVNKKLSSDLQYMITYSKSYDSFYRSPENDFNNKLINLEELNKITKDHYKDGIINLTRNFTEEYIYKLLSKVYFELKDYKNHLIYATKAKDKYNIDFNYKLFGFEVINNENNLQINKLSFQEVMTNNKK